MTCMGKRIVNIEELDLEDVAEASTLDDIEAGLEHPEGRTVDHLDLVVQKLSNVVEESEDDAVLVRAARSLVGALKLQREARLGTESGPGLTAMEGFDDAAWDRFARTMQAWYSEHPEDWASLVVWGLECLEGAHQTLEKAATRLSEESKESLKRLMDRLKEEDRAYGERLSAEMDERLKELERMKAERSGLPGPPGGA